MVFKSSLVLLAMLAFVAAHPGHSDVLSPRELREWAKRQNDVLKCRNNLAARSTVREGRVLAKRDELVAGGFVPPASFPAFPSFPALPAAPSAIASSGAVSSSSASYFPTTTAGAAPASATTQLSDGACALQPAQEEGPYYIAGEDIRSDLREDEPGIPFYATFNLIDTNTCEPLVNAAIDIWSCNSTGEYAGFISSDGTDYDTSLYNGETTHLGDQNDGGSTITDAETFLRGQQLTDEAGEVHFTTLIPGWYEGRAPHVHLRVHVGGEVTENGTYIGGNLSYTGQTFFGDDIYQQVKVLDPYNLDTNDFTTNDEDRPWSQQNGTYAAWALYYVDETDLTQGLIGFLNVAVDSQATDQTGSDVGGGGDGGAPPSGSMSGGPAPTGSVSGGPAPSSSA